MRKIQFLAIVLSILLMSFFSVNLASSQDNCIDLEKTGPDTAMPGDTITYHFWVQNCGNSPNNAEVYDPLFGSGSIWSGRLESGAVVEFEMTYTVTDDDCGDFTNAAWATGQWGECQDRDDDSWTVFVDCVPPQNCWFTAGGVKFESITGMRMAENNSSGGGPKDSVGGVAYPSCSPFPSNGGQWNHIAHSLKLHLIGKDITVLECGNADGTDPGSESPECPVNFIEFEGTGIVKGIHGNKIEDIPVTFFVRGEDRNEPGNEKALNGNGGANIDRYFLRVVDVDGNLLILVDVDGIDNGAVDPLTITGGNFQMHCTSCF